VIEFWSYVSWIVGGIAIVVAVISGLHKIYKDIGPPWPTQPIIDIEKTSNARPMAIPFIIKNPSSLFPIEITAIGCIIYRLEPITEGRVHIAVGAKPVSRKIPALERCPMLTSVFVGARDDITAVELDLVLTYITLRFPFRLPKTAIHRVNWLSGSWTLGEILQ